MATNLTRLEVVKTSHPSAKLSLGATTTLTQREHSGRPILLDATATAVTLTLPAAGGTGMRFEFIVVTTNTSNYVIQVENSTDEMHGQLQGVDHDTSDASVNYPALTGDNFDTITIGDVAEGQQGSYFELIDLAVGVWHVRGQVIQSGGSEADPFSAAV